METLTRNLGTIVIGTSTERANLIAATAHGFEFWETDTQSKYYSDGVQWNQISSSGAASVSIRDSAGNEIMSPGGAGAAGTLVLTEISNPVSGTRTTLYFTGATSFFASFYEYAAKINATVIAQTTAVTLNTGVANDTALVGLEITAALTGTCVITGFAQASGAAQSITLPAATPAGFKDFKGMINSAGALIITCSNAADNALVTAIWQANTTAKELRMVFNAVDDADADAKAISVGMREILKLGQIAGGLVAEYNKTFSVQNKLLRADIYSDAAAEAGTTKAFVGGVSP